MGWITAEQYHAAAPDPLTHAAAEIISHMNQDHVDAMISIAEHLGGVTATEAVMTAVDYLGFSLRLKTDRGFQAIRIPFKQPLQAAADAQSGDDPTGRGSADISRWLNRSGQSATASALSPPPRRETSARVAINTRPPRISNRSRLNFAPMR